MANVPDPRPTTEEMLRECPRFRILVVGKVRPLTTPSQWNANEGRSRGWASHRSSLIKHACGINIADEIISTQNECFVLHDSMVFETGDEEFLQLSTQNMPVIVVFTQFDTLYSRMEQLLTEEEGELSDEEIHNAATPNSRRFASVINSSVQCARTAGLGRNSTNSLLPVQPALENLIGITQNLVQGTVWYVSAMAQHANAMEKINASIEIGMKRDSPFYCPGISESILLSGYWQSLGSSTELLGLKLEICMKLLHYDITASWNFDDDKLLNSDNFMQQIKSFAQLVTPSESEANSWFAGQENLYTLLGLAGSALVGVAVPVLAAIRLSIAFIRWLANIYVNTPEVHRFLMAYIADLTLVLDQLFLITLDHRPARLLTMGDIDLAVKNYRTSNTATVHNKIR
ncbi:hypothetical protein C8R45DRAFT_999247 [Mycena sanguinolenta]|nr:hypothetical protein C8R45DRAFT_999247 [Mycena sanguinolenta]